MWAKKDNKASSGVMQNTELTDGSKLNHKFKPGVTGVIKIQNYDFYVKWSDGDDSFERLNSYDIGKVTG